MVRYAWGGCRKQHLVGPWQPSDPNVVNGQGPRSLHTMRSRTHSLVITSDGALSRGAVVVLVGIGDAKLV